MFGKLWDSFASCFINCRLCTCDSIIRIRITCLFLVQECLWELDLFQLGLCLMSSQSNWASISKQFYLIQRSIHPPVMCVLAWSQPTKTEHYLGTQEQVPPLVLLLYNVSPYNNQHWIIDILPEIFKVTFIHSECWICTEVMKEMEIWLV